MVIPKIIHQTHSCWDILPLALKDNIDSIKALNHDYDHRWYEENDRKRFIRNHYGDDLLQLYESIDCRYGAARSDLFRYLCVFIEGGVYLDCKSTTKIPLSSVISEADSYLLSY